MMEHETTVRQPDAAAQAQRTARAFVVALHGAVRAVRLYPVENAAAQRSLQDLSAAAERVMTEAQGCELRRAADYLFVNDTRLRLTLDNYAAVSNVLGLFRDAGIGGFSLVRLPELRAWVVLLAFLQSPPSERPDEDQLTQLAERLTRSAVTDFELSRPTEEIGIGSEPDVDQRERSRQTYARSLDVTRAVMSSTRLGRSPGLKRVKRAVQGIVDSILTDSASMLGLTTLREFDEYTFVHSVNVCILSVSLGRRIGLNKVQLLDLGLAALLHDIGKSMLPQELLNKIGPLDEQERALLHTHPWEGVLSLFAMPIGAGRSWRAITAAYEHHMRIDLSGYPKPVRPRQLSLYSKIIAVADGFDAATTSRAYDATPWSPADVLRGMRDNPRLGLDPVIVKAFINLTGIYPVGTVVVLDTHELALVHAANEDLSALSRPVIRLLSDPMGNPLIDTFLWDLTVKDESGQYVHTIVRTDDPERYGIRVADYFA
jgi:HD-GYP domain-containing protein (c-di-GMP phosphodiesterase class II)